MRIGFVLPGGCYEADLPAGVRGQIRKPGDIGTRYESVSVVGPLEQFEVQEIAQCSVTTSQLMSQGIRIALHLSRFRTHAARKDVPPRRHSTGGGDVSLA